MKRIDKHFLLLLLSICLPLGISAHLEAAKPVVKFTSGHQTTGIGNKDAVLLRAELPQEITSGATKLCKVDLNIEGSNALSKVKVYLTNGNEFLAETQPQLIGNAKAKAHIAINLKEKTQSAGKKYLWITADIKPDATFGSTFGVKVNTLTCKVQKQSESVQLEGTLQNNMRVFKQQKFVFVPNTDNCRFYRIPAMIMAGDTIVVVSDKRYDDIMDLGNHKIDLVRRYSTDGGATWSAPLTFAVGDGTSQSAYGFGDAALARAKDGRLICLMAAGKDGFWGNMVYSYMSCSADGGNTWSTPVNITASERFTDKVNGVHGPGFSSFFVSSGKGLTSQSGRVMFLAVVREKKNTPIDNYVLYTDDEGATWTLDSALVYHKGDEAKLIYRPDGSILASIRCNGARGFNVGSETGTQWGTQHVSTQLTGAACNADIVAYDKDLMVHSLLINPKPRKDLRIYSSTDQGATWQERLLIQPGDAAYSTMVRLPNGDLAILYEDGTMFDNGYAINWLTIPAEVLETWKK